MNHITFPELDASKQIYGYFLPYQAFSGQQQHQQQQKQFSSSSSIGIGMTRSKHQIGRTKVWQTKGVPYYTPMFDEAVEYEDIDQVRHERTMIQSIHNIDSNNNKNHSTPSSQQRQQQQQQQQQRLFKRQRPRRRLPTRHVRETPAITGGRKLRRCILALFLFLFLFLYLKHVHVALYPHRDRRSATSPAVFVVTSSLWKNTMAPHRLPGTIAAIVAGGWVRHRRPGAVHLTMQHTQSRSRTRTMTAPWSALVVHALSGSISAPHNSIHRYRSRTRLQLQQQQQQQQQWRFQCGYRLFAVRRISSSSSSTTSLPVTMLVSASGPNDDDDDDDDADTPSPKQKEKQDGNEMDNGVSSMTRRHGFGGDSEHNNNNGDNDDDCSEEDPPPLSSLACSIRDRVRKLLRHHGYGYTGHPPTTTIRLPIVVSVSGGCDSVALFHALMEWNRALQLQFQAQTQARMPQPPMRVAGGLELFVTVVHFHHQQRPGAADADCRLVRDLVANATATATAAPDVQFHKAEHGHPAPILVVEDWKNYQNQNNASASLLSSSGDGGGSFSQDKARNWRREALHKRARDDLNDLRLRSKMDSDNRNHATEVPFGLVLTAHHDDDAYETVLLKLIRGVHLLNLHDRATIRSIAPLSTDSDCDSDPNQKQKREQEQPSLYLMRPFVTDHTNENESHSTTLTGHGKADLVRYLEEHNHTWREDASNKDPKYLRNRVRNELIPLLRDLGSSSSHESDSDGDGNNDDCDAVRNKRLPAALEQSRDLRDDVTPRVEAYLEQRVVTSRERGSTGAGTGTFYRIDHDPGAATTSRLIRSQALYEWMSGSIRNLQRGNDLNSSNSNSNNSESFLSHDSLRRVLRQLEGHPDRRAWTLELGSGWSVRRRGDVLEVIGTTGTQKTTEESKSHDDDGDADWMPWDWNMVAAAKQEESETDSESQEPYPKPPCLADQEDTASRGATQAQEPDVLRLRLPPESVPIVHTSIKNESVRGTIRDHNYDHEANTPSQHSNLSLAFGSMPLQTAEKWLRGANDTDTATAALWFCPPWRNSPVKVRAFLRGQKIPLHERDPTLVLVAEWTNNSDNGIRVGLAPSIEKVNDKANTTPTASIRRRLVAIRVREEWIIDRAFSIVAPEPESPSITMPNSAANDTTASDPGTSPQMQVQMQMPGGA